MQDAWLTETYFDWLRRDAFSDSTERRTYEGVLRVLHDIPFYWTMVSDSNRAGDAISFRQYDFLSGQQDLGRLDQHWLHAWSQMAPSVLEVMLGISRHWYQYFEGPIQLYFGHLFVNMGFDRFPGRELSSATQEAVRHKVDVWMSRQFQPNGEGSPFPIRNFETLDVVNFREVDIWSQMNAYSLEHFQ
jgi:hypothetical protein